MRTILISIVFLASVCQSANKDTDVKVSTTKKRSNQEEPDSIRQQRCDAILDNIRRDKADTLGKIKWIPPDFEASLRQLDSLTGPRLRDWIICLPDQEFAIRVHHSLGMYLRNAWGLWGESPLQVNLTKMGILHPDDMTAIILTTFQRRLKGEDDRLQEQLQYYQDFWRKDGVPVDSILNARRRP